jgi:hypothetical protein
MSVHQHHRGRRCISRKDIFKKYKLLLNFYLNLNLYIYKTKYVKNDNFMTPNGEWFRST